jgi:hypothetical protein
VDNGPLILLELSRKLINNKLFILKCIFILYVIRSTERKYFQEQIYGRNAPVKDYFQELQVHYFNFKLAYQSLTGESSC